MLFDWDEDNIRHVARHKVTPQEFEEIVRNGADPRAIQGANREMAKKSKSTMIGKKSTLTPAERKAEAEYAQRLWKDRKRVNKLAQETLERYAREAWREKIVIPRFKSETEEAEWLAANADIVTRLVERARKAGTLSRGPSQVITIRLAESDLADARVIAGRKGLPYQTYIRMLLHEALQREKAAS